MKRSSRGGPRPRGRLLPPEPMQSPRGLPVGGGAIIVAALAAAHPARQHRSPPRRRHPTEAGRDAGQMAGVRGARPAHGATAAAAVRSPPPRSRRRETRWQTQPPVCPRWRESLQRFRAPAQAAATSPANRASRHRITSATAIVQSLPSVRARRNASSAWARAASGSFSRRPSRPRQAARVGAGRRRPARGGAARSPPPGAAPPPAPRPA